MPCLNLVRDPRRPLAGDHSQSSQDSPEYSLTLRLLVLALPFHRPILTNWGFLLARCADASRQAFGLSSHLSIPTAVRESPYLHNGRQEIPRRQSEAQTRQRAALLPLWTGLLETALPNG